MTLDILFGIATACGPVPLDGHHERRASVLRPYGIPGNSLRPNLFQSSGQGFCDGLVRRALSKQRPWLPRVWSLLHLALS